MSKGKVLFYRPEKGWGLILCKEGKIYVHHTGLKGCKHLKMNQEVAFTIDRNERGLIAKDVMVVKDA